MGVSTRPLSFDSDAHVLPLYGETFTSDTGSGSFTEGEKRYQKWKIKVRALSVCSLLASTSEVQVDLSRQTAQCSRP